MRLPADEDNRQAQVSPGQLLLKIEPASSGQSHIEHKAGGCVRTAARNSSTEANNLQPDGSEQAADPLPDCGIIIDNDNGWCRLGHHQFSPERSAFPRHPLPAPARWSPGFAA